MTDSSREAPFEKSQRDRTVQEEYEHDAYKSSGKLPEPTVCPKCKALFHKGRWTWQPPPGEAHQEMCPACHRIHDKYPAGYLTLSGPFLKEHKDEVLSLARNEEARAKAEHPLRRIMTIEENKEGILICTTDTHLPRRIGEAIKHAFHGELHFRYAEDEKLLRVAWKR
jgi:NMD protein affecting ribosome stability and mRNA decay